MLPRTRHGTTRAEVSQNTCKYPSPDRCCLPPANRPTTAHASIRSTAILLLPPPPPDTATGDGAAAPGAMPTPTPSAGAAPAAGATAAPSAPASAAASAAAGAVLRHFQPEFIREKRFLPGPILGSPLFCVSCPCVSERNVLLQGVSGAGRFHGDVSVCCSVRCVAPSHRM